MSTDLIRDLVSRLVAEDVHLYVDGSDLKYRARKGAIQDADRERVKAHKAAIIEYLSKLQQVEAATPAALPAIERVGRDGRGLPLSYGQQRLWFIDQLEGRSTHYNTQSTLFIGGTLDVAALEQALADLLERHETLRTCYVNVGGEPRQIVKERRSPPLTHRHLTTVRDEDKQAQISRWIQGDAGAPFYLSRDVVRASIITLTPEAHLLVVTIHHIATDGWSSGIFEREFRELYDARRSGRPANLSPLRIQYADYAVWQRGWLREGVLNEQLEYWKGQLSGAPRVHSLPLDKVRPSRQTFTGKLLQRSIAGATTRAIRTACDAEGVTAFMFMQTVFAVLLGKYSCQKDVMMGFTTAGRVHQDLEGLIGLFMNLLVLRTDLSGKPTFRELLQRNKRVILQAHANQYVPFERIVEEICPERNLSHNALVQILFSVLKYEPPRVATPAGNGNGNGDGNGDGALNGRAGAGSSPAETAFTPVSTRYDLKLDVLELPDGLSLRWLYNDSLFADESIQRLAESYEVLLANVLDDLFAGGRSRRDIDSLELVGTATRSELVAQEAARTQRGGLVHGLFEGAVARDPRAVAVVHESLELTYEELNERANRLAHLLLKKGVAPDGLVVLSVKRSVDMVVGLLAILKAGGAYVPVDPELPAARVAYLLSDCKPLLVLAHSDFRNKCSIDESRLVCLDDAATLEQLQECAVSNPQIADELLSPENLAYAIYTSGSTGEPKGVLVSHDSVCDFLVHAVEAFLPDHVAGAVVSSPLSFDATVGSLLVPLCGARYAELLPDDAFVLDKLRDRLCDDEEAMLFKLTPSHLEALAADGLMKKNPAGRHVVVVAGEPLLPATIAHWSGDLLPASLFINEYGPTETTVGSTTHPVRRPMDYADGKSISVPIGRAFGEMQLYVLNDELCLQGPGGIGELFIGGAGVARGYLNECALTAERFLPNPFTTHPGSRFYRSGDLARQLPDGTVEYVGRVDCQVKIRGIRVEPAEIEAHLLKLQEVAEAVVLARTGVGEGILLTAYVVVTRSQRESTDISGDYLKASIKDQLARQLPAYMVPDVYVLLDKLPLNSHGKIDRSALPAAGDADLVKEAYVPPSNMIEAELCRLWQTLLKVERVGIFDDFFSLGGHSLLAIRLVSAIRHEFGVEIELRALFESPTIAALSKLLGRADDRSVLPPITRVSRERPLPLSFAQQRLWFIDQLNPGSALYNMPDYFTLEGQFREDAFLRALQSLLDRHEVLRTRFITVNGEARQVVVQDYELPFTRVDLSELPEELKATECQRLLQEEAERPFNLGADLMLRVRWMRWDKELHLILLTMNHIASDGWSRMILQRELSMLYAAHCKGEPNPFPPLAIQYADYAVWQRQWLQGSVLEQGLAYWKQQLADLPPLHSFPLDKARPAIPRHEGRTHELLIGPELAAGIAALNRKHNTTLFMFMHTALAVLLSRYSGERDIAIGSAATTRTHRDLEPLIGFFINDLVLRMQVDGTRGFAELLKQHKETTLDAYAHQHIPFEMLVGMLNPPRSISYEPLFQIRLEMRGNEDSRLSLVDLEVLSERGTEASGERIHVVHDLYVSVAELKNGLSLYWRYNTDLFLPETIVRLCSHFRTLLEGIVAAPEQPVHSLRLLTKVQEQRLLKAGEGPQATNAQGKPIQALFEEQAERTPDGVAVVYEGRELTYGELNRRANRLAHELIERGVGPEVRVGLCLERSAQMVIGILGILKAGGAYVPLDPSHPGKRLAYAVEDSGIALAVGEPSQWMFLDEAHRPQCVAVEEGWGREALGDRNPDVQRPSSALAYVIYTSGSTGKPKGVRISHGNVVNFLLSMQEELGIGSGDRLLAVTTLSFDIALLELYLPLTVGGTVDIAPAAMVADGERLMRRLEESQITVLQGTPVTWRLLLDSGWEGLKRLTALVGGEAFSRELATRLEGKVGRVWNLYGPTETTIWSTCASVAGPVETWTVPIGKPIANTKVYVLDGEQRLAPAGAVGQLYVAGAGVSQGYLNRPGLTAEKFIPHPFSVEPGERLYGTGDLARWLPEGRLECLGRVDQQVKVRGYRIELGEIESVLLGHEGVRDAVVAAREDEAGGKRLVGYVVAEAGASADPATLVNALRGRLQEQLPGYMVPSTLMVLESLPLTANGKVDRKALPVLEKDALLRSRYVAPRDEFERKLCEVWQELLKLERVGIHDNFFELGGHSLQVIKLVTLILEATGMSVTVVDLYANPTIASFADAMKDAAVTET